MAIQRADFPLPDVDDPLTAPYFAGAAAGELVIPRCERCARYVWYPEPRVPECGGGAPVDGGVGPRHVVLVGGRAARVPARVRRAGAVRHRAVALDEDPAVRIVSYVVDADPDAARRRHAVVVDFRPLAFPTVPDHSVVVPMFRP